MNAIALLVAVAAAACSDSGASSPSCHVQVAGDTSETATLSAHCATLSPAGDGGAGYVLTVSAQTDHLSSLSITVPLGDPPSPGVYSSASLTDWSAVASVAGDSNCAYSAGTSSVPTGNLILNLTSVEGGRAHGTLKATLYVHAPLFTDCGRSDAEEVAFAF
ncbi:MAG TPA: hypothetical protein VHC69_33600 [Polyangiaceae bacterium]|nr:hypothetical protein [Polyangiaceae bacterium]